MKRILKLNALLLALLIICSSLLCSCSYKAIKPSEEDMTVVGHVGGVEVHLDELRFLTHTYRNILTTRYGEEIFSGAERDKYIAMLKDLVYSNITANYATLLLCNEAQINLGEQAVLDKVEERMLETVEQLGGVSEYKKYLKENFLTDRLLRFNTEIDILQNELMYVYVDDILLIEDNDDKIYDIIMDEFIGVRHVFVSHSTENASDKINSARLRLNAGEKFSTVMLDLDEDEDMTTDGLYIMDGYMTDEYQNVAFSLKFGEVSNIVEDEHGYYIIERIELSPIEVMRRFDYLKKIYQTYTFYAIIDQKQAELVFTPTQAGIDFMADPLKYLN
ncbi:MAG: hypothetical protein E7653_00070 [Ruminococcaceae bacterium]|nr:hypothetical protein [Oscillospiraceae bacterium]